MDSLTLILRFERVFVFVCAKASAYVLLCVCFRLSNIVVWLRIAAASPLPIVAIERRFASQKLCHGVWFTAAIVVSTVFSGFCFSILFCIFFMIVECWCFRFIGESMAQQLVLLLLRCIFLNLPFVSHLAIFCLLSKLVCAHWKFYTPTHISPLPKISNKTIFHDTKCCAVKDWQVVVFFLVFSILLSTYVIWQQFANKNRSCMLCIM